MHRISAGLATCLVAAVTVGCGTVHVEQPGSPGPTKTPGIPTAASAKARAASGCQSAAPLITQADNGKTYCVQVGDTVDVFLQSNDANLWLQPLASSGVLKAVPNGEASLVKGATGAWFAAVRPGQALVTSVRPPCQVMIPAGKGDLQPADQVPRAYPLRFCAPGHRFSVSIIVVD